MSNDPWAKYRKTSTAPQPVQVPSTELPPVESAPPPRMPYSPAKVQQQAQQQVKQQAEMQNAETRIAIDQRQDARAAEDHGAKMRTLDANGGVDTQASQDQAAGHALNLTRQLITLDKVNPKSRKPGLLEVGVEMLTDNPNVLSIVRGNSDDGDRQISAAALGSALESLTWLSTGAAVTEPQGRRYMNEITPFYGDSPKVLEWKRQNLLGRIAEAKVRAGPANVKVQEALDMLGLRAEAIYAPDRWKGDGLDQENPSKAYEKLYNPRNAKSPWYDDNGRPMHSISDVFGGLDPERMRDTDYQLQDYPVEANALHAQWVKSHPNATAQEYGAFRQELDKMFLSPEEFSGTYDPGFNYNSPETLENTTNFLDWHRANPNSEVAPIHWKKKLSGFDKARNWLNDQDPGGFVNTLSNAGTAGVVDLLTDEQSRAAIHRKRSKNWKTTVAAEMLGAALPVSKIAKGVGWLGKAAGKEITPALATNLANVGYGAIRGAEDAPEGRGLEGALTGGLAALPGSVIGTKIAGGSRARVPSKLQAQIDKLGDVEDMTLMQATGRGTVEEGLQGLPKVREARAASIAGFNRGNVNRTLKLVGEKLPKDVDSGFEANAHMNKVLGDRYNKLIPKINGSFDTPYRNAFAALRRKALASGDALKSDLWKSIESVQSTFKNGKFNGAAFKDANQKLNDLAQDWLQVEAGPGVTSPSTYREMGQLALKVKDNLRAQVSRTHPKLAAELKALDSAWARKLRIENATNRSTTGIYSPKQLLTSIKMLDPSKGRGKFARGQALDQDWAKAADDVLGSATPAEHANLMQTAMAYYTMLRHPVKVGLPIGAFGLINYTPGVRDLAKILATTKRPDYYMKVLPAAFAQGQRAKTIENMEK